MRYLHEVPAGDYFVQVVLHRYETFHRADGHTVKLPMDRGEGQHWQLAPGNLYSKAQKITLGTAASRFDCAGPNYSRRFPSRKTRIHSPHQDSERTAYGVVGTPDVFERESCWFLKDSMRIRMRIFR